MKLANLSPLQALTALLGVIPIVTGLLTMLGVDDPIYAHLGLPASPLLDNNLSFFGGVWLGLGLAVLWMVPRLEREGTLFIALWGMIFLGGVGRLISMLLVGLPPVPFILLAALEVIGAPACILWYLGTMPIAAPPGWPGKGGGSDGSRAVPRAPRR